MLPTEDAPTTNDGDMLIANKFEDEHIQLPDVCCVNLHLLLLINNHVDIVEHDLATDGKTYYDFHDQHSLYNSFLLL